MLLVWCTEAMEGGIAEVKLVLCRDEIGRRRFGRNLDNCLDLYLEVRSQVDSSEPECSDNLEVLSKKFNECHFFQTVRALWREDKVAIRNPTEIEDTLCFKYFVRT